MNTIKANETKVQLRHNLLFSIKKLFAENGELSKLQATLWHMFKYSIITDELDASGRDNLALWYENILSGYKAAYRLKSQSDINESQIQDLIERFYSDTNELKSALWSMVSIPISGEHVIEFGQELIKSIIKLYEYSCRSLDCLEAYKNYNETQS